MEYMGRKIRLRIRRWRLVSGKCLFTCPLFLRFEMGYIQMPQTQSREVAKRRGRRPYWAARLDRVVFYLCRFLALASYRVE